MKFQRSFYYGNFTLARIQRLAAKADKCNIFLMNYGYRNGGTVESHGFKIMYICYIHVSQSC